jgi:hypothetical protein
VDDWLAALLQRVEANEKIAPRVGNSNKSEQKSATLKKKATPAPRKTVKGKK